MSKEKLARMTARVLEAEEKKEKQTTGAGKKSGGDNASFQFWNTPIGKSTTIRFYPDGDEKNDDFWVKREIIKLPFAGQIGGDYQTDAEVVVTVPCADMFKEKTCPIIQATRPWWKQGPEKEKLARLYYKKVSYITQGGVISSPIVEDEVPENPIRRFILSPQIFGVIWESLKDPQIESSPDDYVGGYDFSIKVTKQGEHKNYSTSHWRHPARALSDSETLAIQQWGLNNLGDFRGLRPDAEGLALIFAMFKDSIAGRPFDFDSYGHAYRAYGSRGSLANQTTDQDAPSHVTQIVAQKVAVNTPKTGTMVSEPEDEAEETVKPVVAADILARIRNKVPAKTE